MQPDNEQQAGLPGRIRPTRLIRDYYKQGAKWDKHEENDVAVQPTMLVQSVEKSGSYLPIDSHGQKTMLPPAESSEQVRKQFTSPSAFNFPIDDEDMFDISMQSTNHLMQLSGMMQAVRPPSQQQAAQPNENAKPVVEEWWPDGIRQTGAMPIVNLYGKEPFGRTHPNIPAVSVKQKQSSSKKPGLLASPIVKVILGLVIGVGLLFLVAKFVDIPTTVSVLRANLTTPRGILMALLSGLAFLGAFSIRGMRWKLFLNPIGKVSTVKAIQLFLVGIFLNFLLPIRGGEVAKSLMLKRIAGIPVSQSLPTVAMDKALDLMPALFIMAIVPLLGVSMDIKLWLVLGAVGGLLIGLIFFVGLAAWKRTAAIALLQKITSLLPKAIAGKIEGFATGFVDSLLAGASRPRIFVPAVLLTIVAVVLDGLFAMLAFWTVGVNIPFGTAIFGYTVYNMFYILPTPPGQVGSNEAIGLLVFYGLLHLDAHGVTAMFFFSHPWAALLMCLSGMGCLSALGMTISSAMKVQNEEESAETPQPQEQAVVQRQPVGSARAVRLS